MSNELWSKVDTYLNQTLLQHDSALEQALAANTAAGLPPIDVTPTQGKFLELLVQISAARRILEIGTLGGYSTIWLARALPPDGSLLSLEVNPTHAAVAQSNLARAGLAGLVEIRLGPALQTLAHLHSEQTPPFDIIFIDADKSNSPGYLSWALQLSHPGTIILVDNVVREGAVADPASADADVLGIQQCLAAMASNPRLSATALQTVGSKGWDGFAMARVLNRKEETRGPGFIHDQVTASEC
jgi:predicted O-methyltransferase YrrM